MGEYAGPRSLRQLLDAVLTVGSDLDLPAMLERIIQAAVDLVDARFGALGVLDETRTRLAQFITVGLDDETYRAIGELPEGHGILGLLIVDAKPLRLPDLREHPDSYGFPPNHPPMRSFLGVPIRVRDEVFGNLYLTDKTSAEVFTDVDEELVVGLAAAAGVAIENTRLHTRVQELALVEDRERIARDLHDSIVQRLFATGLSLQGAAGLIRSDADAAMQRVNAAVDDLDLTVKHIRSAIFGLESAIGRDAGGLRRRVLDLAAESRDMLGFEPTVLFEGQVDSATPDAVAADALATAARGPQQRGSPRPGLQGRRRDRGERRRQRRAAAADHRRRHRSPRRRPAAGPWARQHGGPCRGTRRVVRDRPLFPSGDAGHLARPDQVGGTRVAPCATGGTPGRPPAPTEPAVVDGPKGLRRVTFDPAGRAVESR